MATLSVTDLPVPAKDERFPSTNQALNCWNKYNEWVSCLKKNGDDESKCYASRLTAKSLCPGEWVEKWDGDRDAGKFAGLGAGEGEHHH